MIHRPGHHARRGMFLVQALVYVVVLAALAEVAFSAFFALQQGGARVRMASEDIVVAMEAGERWRADIRAAAGLVTATADELRIPTKDGDPVRYRWTDGRILRHDGRGGEQVLLRDVAETRFIRDPREHVTAWRWELALQANGPNPRVRPLFTFLAVPVAAP